VLSKNQIKLISSLKKKKFRDQHGLFIAEGHKLVSDLLKSGLKAKFLIYTHQWLENNTISSKYNIETCIECDINDIKKISNFNSAPQILCVFNINNIAMDKSVISSSLSILLDDLQDPGNLGTIIRIADWFGIKNIFCSTNTVDIYNPKVVQASMGAISSVNVFYTDLSILINNFKANDFPIFGTFLEGTNIYKTKLSEKGFIIMGNEGQGISSEIESLVSTKLNIPDFPSGHANSESLNVSIAASIICSEFRRRL